MTFTAVVLRSLKQHFFSSFVSGVSIACAVSLFVAVISLREQAHRQFIRDDFGVDAVIGPKGSPLQIVLNAVYNLEEMPGKISWKYLQMVKKQEIVTDGFAFVTGHSYAGIRVNAVENRFFTDFEYLPGKKFSCSEAPGKGCFFNGKKTAVAGYEAARNLNISPGHWFNPVCGVNSGDPVHADDRITFCGVLAPTKTPFDRAVYISLEDFYTLEGHGEKSLEMAVNEEFREISGAWLKIKRIRNNLVHPGIQELKYDINQSSDTQLVIPNEVMPALFSIIGWADTVINAIAAMVALLSVLFLAFSLTASLRERRRDLALFRCLGASRRTVFGLLISESLFISITGSIFGVFMGHLLSAVCSYAVFNETGMRFNPWEICSADLFIIPAVALIGISCGFIPACQAYRLDVIKNLSPVS